jgi:probable phosphoglycerate mutase
LKTLVDDNLAACDKYTVLVNSKKFFIVRHGETDYNKKNMVQGSGIDASLNETGKMQARQFFEKYSDMPFDKIYVTGLRRTHESVSGFIQKGVPFEALTGLNEISWGEQEGIPFTPESATLYQQTVRKWSEGHLHERVRGGETPLEVMERQKNAFDHILRQKKEKLILVCMHGRAMRILFSWMLRYPLTFQDQFLHQNLGFYEVTFTGKMFRIDRFNETSHLQSPSIV